MSSHHAALSAQAAGRGTKQMRNSADLAASGGASVVREFSRSAKQTMEPGLRLPQSAALKITLLGLLSILVVLCVGLRNGELNQVFYLLHGLHRAEPGALTRDWYTMQSLSYHQWWDAAVAILVNAHLLEQGLTVGTIALSLLFTVAVYAALRALYEDPLLPAAAATLVFCGIFTRGLGSWDLLAPSIEPFSVSGVLMICGLAFLARREPVAAGISLGLSALLHSHFAVLLAGVIALAALPIWRFEGLAFTIRVLLPFALLAAPTLWRVLHFATAPGGDQALQILSSVGPQHYFPWRVSSGPFVVFVGSIVFGAAGFRLQRPQRRPALYAVVLSAVALVTGSLLLCAAGASSSLERALPWRLSSMVILVGLMSGCAGLFSATFEPFTREKGIGSRQGQLSFVVALLALGAIAAASTSRGRWSVLIVIATLLFSAFAAWKHWSGSFRWASAVSLVLIFGFAPIALAELPKFHWRIRTMEPETEGVYRWARYDSPQESLWAVPPTWKDFRLNARRSVLADWSATPFFPADVIEWNRRMLDLTGLPKLRTSAEVSAAYDRIDCARIDRLQHTYGLDYVVLATPRTLACGSRVFSDSRFAIWQLPRR